MGALDTTIVNISLPTMATYFNTSITIVSWVAMAYLLTLSATLIAFGKFADIRGYRKVYLWGFAIFAIGSLACGMLSMDHRRSDWFPDPPGNWGGDAPGNRWVR